MEQEALKENDQLQVDRPYIAENIANAPITVNPDQNNLNDSSNKEILLDQTLIPQQNTNTDISKKESDTSDTGNNIKPIILSSFTAPAASSSQAHSNGQINVNDRMKTIIEDKEIVNDTSHLSRNGSSEGLDKSSFSKSQGLNGSAFSKKLSWSALSLQSDSKKASSSSSTSATTSTAAVAVNGEPSASTAFTSASPRRDQTLGFRRQSAPSFTNRRKGAPHSSGDLVNDDNTASSAAAGSSANASGSVAKSRESPINRTRSAAAMTNGARVPNSHITHAHTTTTASSNAKRLGEGLFPFSRSRARSGSGAAQSSGHGNNASTYSLYGSPNGRRIPDSIQEYDAILRWAKESSLGPYPSPHIPSVNYGTSSSLASPSRTSLNYGTAPSLTSNRGNMSDENLASSPLQPGSPLQGSGNTRRRSNSVVQMARSLASNPTSPQSARRIGSVHAIDLGVLNSLRIAAEMDNQERNANANATAAAGGSNLDLLGLLRVDSKLTVASEASEAIANQQQQQQQKNAKSDVDVDEMESCLICMGKFTRKKPPIHIPCTKKCNLAPVHAKCIYEWKCQGSGTCPLCRSELGKVDYKPRDILGLDTLFIQASRRSFMSSPVPKSVGVVRMYIRVVDRSSLGAPSEFQLFVQGPTTRKYPLGPLPPLQGLGEGDHLVACAKRHVSSLTGKSYIDMTIDLSGKDYSRPVKLITPNENSTKSAISKRRRSSSSSISSSSRKLSKALASGSNYLGTVYSSFNGLSYVAKVPYRSKGVFSRFDEVDGETEIAAVRYEQNRFGQNAGPRKMHMCIPQISEVDPKKYLHREISSILDGQMKRAAASSSSIDESHLKDAPKRNRLNSRQIPAVSAIRLSSADETQRKESMGNATITSSAPPSPKESGSPNMPKSLVGATDTVSPSDAANGKSSDDEKKGNNNNPDSSLADLVENHIEDDDSGSDDENTATMYHTNPHIPSAAVPSLLEYISGKKQSEDNTNRPAVIALKNKEPYFLESIQAFSLDFEGRVTLPSNKNFIVSLPEFHPDGGNILLFGKIATIDRGDPFTTYTGDFNFGPEKEITKYSFLIGKGLIKGTFKYRDPHTWMTSPALYLFMDESWEDYHKAPACEDKMNFAHSSIPIGKLTESHTHVLQSKLGKATKTDILTDGEGNVIFTFEWEVEHKVRTHGWFLVVADCALEQFNARVPPMQYTIELYNEGLTHLPADEYGIPKLILFTFCAMCGFFGWTLLLLHKHYQETHSVHLVITLLIIAFVAELLAMFLELVHLWRYRSDGFGFFFADFSSEIFEGISQTIISFVLICLASGWTLIEAEADEARANSVATLLRNPKKILQGANIVIVLIIVVVILSMVLQVMNKSYDDNFSKFHDFESTPGHLLVALRFLLGVAFVFSLHRTIQHQSKRGGDQLVMFLRRLMLFGGLWFLAFPVLVLAASRVPHYFRHRLVTGGVLILQSACLCSLSYQFMSEHSTYFKISVLSDAGALPGAGGFVKAQKISKD